MLCNVCHDMLYAQKGRKGSGSQLQLAFEHHTKFKHLRDSAKITGCYVCRVIKGRLEDHSIDTDDVVGQKGAFLTASLRHLRRGRSSGLYHLDFWIKKKNLLVASFVLRPHDTESSADLNAKPVSSTTSDSRVFRIAKDWIDDCASNHTKCRLPPDAEPWYPSRLLDLKSILHTGRATEVVRLVSQKGAEVRRDQPSFEDSYITLSHRWGIKPFFKLTEKTLAKFLAGIPLRKLPQTFQDAVKVCCELQIRWLWIDALCIIQEQDDLTDWLEESPTMEKVYTHAYCNISATAAEDSSKGLFSARDMNWKWVENVKLSLKDLREGSAERINCTILDLAFWEKYVDNAPVNRRSWVYQERLLAQRVLHWCQDQIAFECQEMSRAECRPQGLPHFRYKSGLIFDGVRLKSVDIDAGKQLRKIREAHSSGGKSPESGALQRIVDQIEPKFHLYELWKHWVEVYTKMELTKARDRLIAFSGIARLMTSRLQAEGIEDEYIAGMWKNHLASQLLWYVNEGTGKNRQPFEDTRPKDKVSGVPSFSWAAVETRRGVSFPETKDDNDPGLLLNLEVLRLSYGTEKDLFGIITDGYVVLRGVLRKIELSDSMTPKARSLLSKRDAFVRSIDWHSLFILALAVCCIPFVVMQQICGLQCLVQYWSSLAIWTTCYGTLSIFCFVLRTLRRQMMVEDPEDLPSEHQNRYSWRLVQNGQPVGKNYQIVYLDSPASEPSIFGPKAQVYCLPALREDRYLTCLLVQATDGEYGVRYKRVGLTKVSSLTQDLLHNLTTPPIRNETLSGKYYWGSSSRKEGESTICII